MAKLKETYSCSLILVNDLIGGKWKMRILWHIIHGDNRFSLLQKTMPDISEKMLTTQLKELESNGLIDRRVICEKPLNVQYAFSEKFPDLKQIVESLCEFSRGYADGHGIIIDD